MASRNGPVQLQEKESHNEASGELRSDGNRRSQNEPQISPGSGSALAEGGTGGSPGGVEPVDTRDPDSLWHPARTALSNVRAPYGHSADPARVKFPNAFAFLTTREFVSGKTREVPRVMLEAVVGGFKVTMTDYNISVAYSTTFETLESLLDALERGFRPDAVGWKDVKVGEGYKKRKSEEERKLANRKDVV